MALKIKYKIVQKHGISFIYTLYHLNAIYNITALNTIIHTNNIHTIFDRVQLHLYNNGWFIDKLYVLIIPVTMYKGPRHKITYTDWIYIALALGTREGEIKALLETA